jgi:hypothetical protein
MGRVNTRDNNLGEKMALYDDIHARNHAVALVTKALESGSIKLGGPSSGTTEEKAGEHDAQYLASLIHTLTKRLSE